MSVDTRVAAALVLLGAGYYAVSLARFGFGFGDEGYLYYVAWSHLQGRAFYEQIVLHSYLPGVFVPFTWLFSAVGPSVVAARVVMAVGLTVTPVLLYFAARPLAGRVPALVAAVVVLVVPAPWHKFYVGLLAAATACAGVALVRDGSARAAFGLGAVVGVAWWVRLDAAIAGSGLIVAAMALRWWAAGCDRRLVVAALGGLAGGLAPGLAMLAGDGSLAGFARQCVAFPLAIARRSASAENLAPPALARLGRVDALGAEAWVFYGSFVAFALLALLAVRRLVGRPGGAATARRTETAALVFAALWALTNVPQYALERPDLPHLAQRLGPLVLALAVLAGAAWDSGRGVLVVVPAAYALLLVWILGVHDPAAGGAWQRDAAVWRTGPTGIAYPIGSRSTLPPLMDRIAVDTQPDDVVPVWPYLPGVSFLAGRRTPGRYPMVFPDMMTAAVEDELLRDLEHERVRVVVYLPEQRMHRNEASAPARFMPRVDAAVRRDYEVVSTSAEGVEIRRRVASPPAARATMPGSSVSR